ncbi:hypothetical protein X961_5162 [Burkholderia pseudomallei MSHR5613]|nr:hypothetical protein BURPS305_5381 [Burkholderia pseudomallei 305]EDK57330.1 hypothetical protein BMAJHU_F0064 [Burkholderia mallei JHU]EEP49750.1 conserved hypothetical protein [Burkholderia pseudomallei MSHR346]KGS43016.1 hypothetical protein X961_5162 [Burkholderia pseudomallei MSHR5613]BEH21093.1 hypothetical protein GTC019_42710 [Burkholderia pseudomallei]
MITLEMLRSVVDATAAVKRATIRENAGKGGGMGGRRVPRRSADGTGAQFGRHARGTGTVRAIAQ